MRRRSLPAGARSCFWCLPWCGLSSMVLPSRFEQVRVVEASGHEIIPIMRRGLTPAQAARLRIADNRAAELSTWNIENLKLEGEAADLSEFFYDKELEAMGLDGLANSAPAISS